MIRSLPLPVLTLARLCYLSVPRVKLSYQVLQSSKWFRPSRHVQKTFQVPHTPIEQFALDNGLRVVLNQDHSVPVVSVAVYYDVGSRNQSESRTGVAHLFENMMFQGSENVPQT